MHFVIILFQLLLSCHVFPILVSRQVGPGCSCVIMKDSVIWGWDWGWRVDWLLADPVVSTRFPLSSLQGGEGMMVKKGHCKILCKMLCNNISRYYMCKVLCNNISYLIKLFFLSFSVLDLSCLQEEGVFAETRVIALPPSSTTKK